MHPTQVDQHGILKNTTTEGDFCNLLIICHLSDPLDQGDMKTRGNFRLGFTSLYIGTNASYEFRGGVRRVRDRAGVPLRGKILLRRFFQQQRCF